MKNKNEFLKEYTKLPTKEDIRRFILGITVFVNVCGYCVIGLYGQIIPYSTIPNFIITLLKGITLGFDLFSVIFYVFPIKMNKLTYYNNNYRHAIWKNKCAYKINI